jgi:hypothetical protein
MRKRGLVAICVVLAGATAAAMQLSEWTPAVSLESVPGTDPALNTSFQDGVRRRARTA